MFLFTLLVVFLFDITSSGFALRPDSENEIQVLRKLEELSTKVEALEEMVTADREAVSRPKKLPEFQKSPSGFQGTTNFAIENYDINSHITLYVKCGNIHYS